MTIDKQKTNEIIAHLAERFSHCFSVSHANRRALKIGIRADLAPLVPFGEDELRAALRYYTRSDGYLRACTEGDVRVDLDGNAAGTVTAKEAAWAQKVLAEREAWRGKRKRPASSSKRRAQAIRLDRSYVGLQSPPDPAAMRPGAMR